MGQITHAFLTRPPLSWRPKPPPPLDLHVLSVPPAFILSQDRTLIIKFFSTVNLIHCCLLFFWVSKKLFRVILSSYHYFSLRCCTVGFSKVPLLPSGSFPLSDPSLSFAFAWLRSVTRPGENNTPVQSGGTPDLSSARMLFYHYTPALSTPFLKVF